MPKANQENGLSLKVFTSRALPWVTILRKRSNNAHQNQYSFSYTP